MHPADKGGSYFLFNNPGFFQATVHAYIYLRNQSHALRHVGSRTFPAVGVRFRPPALTNNSSQQKSTLRYSRLCPLFFLLFLPFSLLLCRICNQVVLATRFQHYIVLLSNVQSVQHDLAQAKENATAAATTKKKKQTPLDGPLEPFLNIYHPSIRPYIFICFPNLQTWPGIYTSIPFNPN